MNTPVIDIKDLSFSYDDETVLRNVNLQIQERDFVAMIGPNGGGKTTLLKLMLGLLSPDGGHIRIFGENPRKVSPFIGYVPQNVHFNDNFPVTAMEVVLMGIPVSGTRWRRRSAEDRHKARDTLERMEVGALAEKRIGALSGGERQRAFIARALVTNPKLLLLDEPTANIDTKGQSDFFKLLKKINEEITILVVSHDLLVISRHIKSVACVNRCLHYHNQAEITGDMLETMYPCTVEDVCPVELVAHGIPHRVLKEHKGDGND